jgi:hypothetical protein
MAKDIFNNHNTEKCQEEAVGNAPDKGVNTGVSDTYGGGLDVGYGSRAGIGRLDNDNDSDFGKDTDKDGD